MTTTLAAQLPDGSIDAPDLLRHWVASGHVDTVGGMATFEVDSSSIVPNAVSGSISYRVLADGSTAHSGYGRIRVYDDGCGSVFSDYTIEVSYIRGDTSYDAQGGFPTDLAAGSYQACATPNDGDHSASGACTSFVVLGN
jgi:hypothetical protein